MRNLFFRQREDLPEMRWPLIVLSFTAAIAGGALGAAVWPTDMLISLFLFLLSVTAYSFLILLWRRVASLLVTPLMALAILLSGSGLLAVFACSLSLLAIAYGYATCCLSGDSRFVRITTVAIIVAVCGFCITLAFCSSRYDSLGEMIQTGRGMFHDLFRRALAALENTAPVAAGAGNDPGTVPLVLLPEAIDSIYYQILAALPALTGLGVICLAAALDAFCGLLLDLLDCREYFSPAEDEGITLPKSFGWIYGVLLLMTVTTSSDGSSRLYSILSNCHWIFALPCAGVGLSQGYRRLRKKMEEASFYRHSVLRSPLMSLVVLVLVMLVLGLPLAFTLTAVTGAVYVARSGRKKTEETDEKS